ncbi:MAG: hypothetical protein HY000_36820 [Planctomycetes bacterium]|nr:hypothetical protein [Planctomycetota bacterium]
MPKKDQDSNHPQPRPVVPKEYAGRWIAWSHDLSRIVATGTTYAEARQAADAAGEPQAYLTKAPEIDTSFVAVAV